MGLRLELARLHGWKFKRRRLIFELAVVRAWDELTIRRGGRELITLDDSELFQLVEEFLLVFVLLRVAICELLVYAAE